ncbi:MAG: flagellar protein FliS, partial [Acinetobacter sp.]|nr:flagellar protein FliS [Acinetobacter sp.]
NVSNEVSILDEVAHLLRELKSAWEAIPAAVGA